MSTKTMRLPPRRVSMPNNNKINVNNHKRKEREDSELKPPVPKSPKPTPPLAGSVNPANSNKLLAGYFAYEFLTKGTVLGKMRDPARAQAAAHASKPDDNAREETAPRGKAEAEKYQRFVEVANLLKTSGAHLSGIVNPSELARFLQF